MEKQKMAVPVKALGMHNADRDFGSGVQFAFNKAAASFLLKRTAAVPSKNINRL
ncbi:hypothetical protein WNY61_18295 [Sulfitobacter sp. AS92]|uniref:hypothetical protein n=1 Tax=Sulfitobacter sp. AS92 TaxID=3135783 RepID=UPI00317EEBC3